jgi:hypothetical protein
LPWFVKENRRAAPRHRYDGSDTWIGPEGSLVRQCQVLDLSQTGVRLAVTNADNLPDTFILILSKNGSGRPLRVKWRRGTEVGAEFLTANSSSDPRLTADAPRANPSSASRLTADAPRAVKPREGESQKSENLSLRTQTQQPDVAKLKSEARKVVGSISGDKAKTAAHRQITDFGGQVDRVDQEKNSKKRMDLSRLQKKLGPKHVALIHALKDVDPESPHGKELASIIESLEETCD